MKFTITIADATVEDLARISIALTGSSAKVDAPVVLAVKPTWVPSKAAVQAVQRAFTKHTGASVEACAASCVDTIRENLPEPVPLTDPALAQAFLAAVMDHPPGADGSLAPGISVALQRLARLAADGLPEGSVPERSAGRLP